MQTHFKQPAHFSRPLEKIDAKVEVQLDPNCRVVRWSSRSPKQEGKKSGKINTGIGIAISKGDVSYSRLQGPGGRCGSSLSQ